MTLVRIDPPAADNLADAVAAAASRIRSEVTGLAAELATLPPDVKAAAGTGAAVAEAGQTSSRFATDASELHRILSLAAALARRADLVSSTAEINDAALLHQVLAMGGSRPDLNPFPTRVVCAAADGVGWVDFSGRDPLDPSATNARLGSTLANMAETVVAGFMGRGGPGAPILGAVSSIGQLLCADAGYKGRGSSPSRPTPAPVRGDPAWRDPDAGPGREDRHANPAGSTASQMPDAMLGAPPP